MTKREEIREGIGIRLSPFVQDLDDLDERQDAELLTNSMMHAEYRKIVNKHLDIILVYLHSQGVVIKAGEIHEHLAKAAADSDTYSADKVGVSWERNAYVFKAFKDAGYVAVEPLIEEEK